MKNGIADDFDILLPPSERTRKASGTGFEEFLGMRIATKSHESDFDALLAPQPVSKRNSARPAEVSDMPPTLIDGLWCYRKAGREGYAQNERFARALYGRD